ncbi:MAG: metal-dependent hydrolase [Bilophila sp.]
MKWMTHKAVALAGALAVQAPPVALVAVLVGSVLPDMIDTALARGNRQVWRRIHRQSSHWFGWYFLLIAAGFALPSQEDLLPLLILMQKGFPGLSSNALMQVEQCGADLVVWTGIGGLSHILLDALTPMRVPIYPFGGRQRFGIKLVSTGTWKESVFLVCAVGIIALQFYQARTVFNQAIQHFW